MDKINKVKILAPAKLNLFLKIINKREDGYHSIRTGITFINLFDELEIKKSNKMQINYSGPFKPQNNNYSDCIISKTIKFLKLKSNFEINIIKNIPVKAGLGAASTNAAAFIKFLDHINLIDMGKIDQYSALGADIPSFLYEKNCLVTGIGDVVSHAVYPKYFFLLVKPNFSNSTKDMYNKLNLGTNGINFEFADININESDNGNDFEKIVLKDNIDFDDIIKSLENLDNSIFSRMTGSGSCCYAVFKNKELAIKAKNKFESKFPNLWNIVCENNY